MEAALVDNDNRDYNRELQVVQTMMSCDITVDLVKLISETRYNLVQCNGQRIYGPPPNWQGPRPPRGCEVFVGRLPKDAFEGELIPILSQPGRIYELRLMMEFSGHTRGFCFVTYVNNYVASRAIKMLHCLSIRPDIRICAYRSLDNSRLFIGCIPIDKSREEITVTFNKIFQGVTNIIVYPNPHDKTKNRGYAFVDFKSHRHALEARKMMWPARLVLWGAQLVAEWAVPLPNDCYQAKLFITNLNTITTTDRLVKTILEKTRNMCAIVQIKRRYNFAVVQFATKHHAGLALRMLRGTNIDGHNIYVKWLKPRNNNDDNSSDKEKEDESTEKEILLHNPKNEENESPKKVLLLRNFKNPESENVGREVMLNKTDSNENNGGRSTNYRSRTYTNRHFLTSQNRKEPNMSPTTTQPHESDKYQYEKNCTNWETRSGNPNKDRIYHDSPKFSTNNSNVHQRNVNFFLASSVSPLTPQLPSHESDRLPHFSGMHYSYFEHNPAPAHSATQPAVQFHSLPLEPPNQSGQTLNSYSQMSSFSMIPMFPVPLPHPPPLTPMDPLHQQVWRDAFNVSPPSPQPSHPQFYSASFTGRPTM